MAKLNELVIELKAKTTNLQNGLRNAKKGLKDTGDEAEKTNKKMAGLSAGFRLLGPLVAAAFSVAALKSIVNAGAQLQQLEARLNAATGGANAATEAMSRLRSIAREQKVDLLELSDGFTRLLPALKGGILSYQQVEQILRLTNDSIKAFGLSTGEAQGIFLGLSQTLSSGTVTTEDLRQVTDRLPGTLANLASAMDMSVGSLKDYIATGKVTADEIVPALIEAFKANEGAAVSMSTTFNSVVTEMENAFRDFAAVLADTGLLDAATSGIVTITDTFELLTIAILESKLAYATYLGDPKDVMAYMKRLDELNGTAGKTTTALDALSGSTGGKGAGIKGNEKAAKAAAKALEKLQDGIDRLAEAAQYDAMAMGMNSVQKAVFDVDVAAASLSKQYGKLTEAQSKQIEETKKLVKANAQQEAAMEAAEKAAQEYADAMSRPFETATENIQNLMTDTFEDLFSGSINSAQDAAESIKKIFIRMAAETATLQLMGPQGLQGVLSGGGGGIGSIGGGSMGGGGMGDLLSMGSTLLSAGGSILPSGVASVVDGIGQSVFGIGQTVSAPFTGAGGAFAEGTMGGISGAVNIANLGAGFAGSLAAGAVFGEGTGTSVGSTAGGIGAGMLASSLTLGPVGAALSIFAGAFMGGGLGSLFGGAEPSSFLQSAAVNPMTGEMMGRGGLTGDKFSQENFDTVTALTQTIAGISQTLSGSIDQIAVASSNRYGLSFALNEGEGAVSNAASPDDIFSSKSPDVFFSALTDEILNSSTKEISEAVKNAIRGIDFGESEKELGKALSDLAFAAAFDSMGETPETIGILEASMQSLNHQFDLVVETTERLGLSIEKVNEIREKEIEKLRDTANQSLYDEILSITDPAALARQQEIARHEMALSDLAAIGADTAAAELLHSLKMENINSGRFAAEEQAAASRIRAIESEISSFSRLVDQFKRLEESLADALLAMQLGSDSALSPEDQLSLARANFEETSNLARIGNTEALAGLPDAINSFLEESRSFNASNEQFKSDFQTATTALNDASGVAGRQRGQAQASLVSAEAAKRQAEAQALLREMEAMRKQQEQNNRIQQDVLLEVQMRA